MKRLEESEKKRWIQWKLHRSCLNHSRKPFVQVRWGVVTIEGTLLLLYLLFNLGKNSALQLVFPIESEKDDVILVPWSLQCLLEERLYRIGNECSFSGLQLVRLFSPLSPHQSADRFSLQPSLGPCSEFMPCWGYVWACWIRPLCLFPETEVYLCGICSVKYWLSVSSVRNLPGKKQLMGIFMVFLWLEHKTLGLFFL